MAIAIFRFPIKGSVIYWCARGLAADNTTNLSALGEERRTARMLQGWIAGAIA